MAPAPTAISPPDALVPDLMTVAEVALVLRLRRHHTYRLCKQWRDTNGKAGIPSLRVGAIVRVRRTDLEDYLGAPITMIPAAPTADESSAA